MPLAASAYFGWYNKSGPALIPQDGLTTLVNFLFGVTTGLVALAGGGQPGATGLAYGYNEVDTVASNNDSVQLPPALPGTFCTIYAAGVDTLAIYANASPNQNNASVLDQMIAVNTNTKTAAASDITLTAGHTTSFMCTTAGLWKQMF
jgi:hypothetical protein